MLLDALVRIDKVQLQPARQQAPNGRFAAARHANENDHKNRAKKSPDGPGMKGKLKTNQFVLHCSTVPVMVMLALRVTEEAPFLAVTKNSSVVHSSGLPAI